MFIPRIIAFTYDHKAITVQTNNTEYYVNNSCFYSMPMFQKQITRI